MSAQLETPRGVTFDPFERLQRRPAGTVLQTVPPAPPALKQATEDEIEAVLARLYEGMSALNRKRRLEGLTRGEEASLEDMKLEIDRWEVFQRDQAGKPEIQYRLEDLALKVIAAVSGKNI